MPWKLHLDAIHCILRYIKCTTSQGVFFAASKALHLKAFIDYDWIRYPNSRHSVIGYLVFVSNALFLESPKKKPTISRSLAELEYRAMASTMCEITWFLVILQDLDIPHSQPTLLFYDNKAALHNSVNPAFHERTKYIEINCHLVQEKLQFGIINQPLHVSM